MSEDIEQPDRLSKDNSKDECHECEKENNIGSNIINTKEIVIDVKENKDKSKDKDNKKINSRELIKSILRSRSRSVFQTNSNQNSAESTPVSKCRNFIPDQNSTPSIEKKPYEFGEIGEPELWTQEIVQQLIDFSDICKESSIKCKNSSIKHKRIGNFIHIMVTLLGTISMTTNIGNAQQETKNIISTVSGGLVAVLTSIQSFLKFPQKSETEMLSSIELERMGRSIKIELSKAKEYRVDPYRYLIKLENQREKIMRSVGISDD